MLDIRRIRKIKPVQTPSIPLCLNGEVRCNPIFCNDNLSPFIREMSDVPDSRFNLKP